VTSQLADLTEQAFTFWGRCRGTSTWQRWRMFEALDDPSSPASRQGRPRQAAVYGCSSRSPGEAERWRDPDFGPLSKRPEDGR
jgi:hypothetical protein